MSRVIQSRKVRIGSALVALALAFGLSASWLEQRAVVEAQAGVQAPKFEVDPMWPKPMPNNWVLGQTIGLTVDDRDHIWLIHRGNDPGTAGLDRTELAVVQPGTPRVGECCDAAPPVLEFDAAGNLVGSWGGQGGRRALRVARVEPRHRGRPQGLRVDRRQRRQRRPHPEVHARRQVRGAVRQVGRAPRSEVDRREAGLHRQQHGHGQLRPRGQDLHRPQGQRRLRGRRLLQPPRRGHRPRQRQDQAHVGRLRQAPDRRGARPLHPRPAARPAVPQPGALLRGVERRHGLRVRPSQRPRAGLRQDRQVHQGGLRRDQHAGRRLGVGHRLLEGRRRRSTSTWPTA